MAKISSALAERSDDTAWDYSPIFPKRHRRFNLPAHARTHAAIGLAFCCRSRPSTAVQSMLEKNASMYFGRSAGL